MSVHLAAECLAMALLLLGIAAIAWSMDSPPRTGSAKRRRWRNRTERGREPMARRVRDLASRHARAVCAQADACQPEHSGLGGRWEREAQRVILLAAGLDVALDREALLLGDVRELMALRSWLVARQGGQRLSSRHPISRQAYLFLAATPKRGPVTSDR